MRQRNAESHSTALFSLPCCWHFLLCHSVTVKLSNIGAHRLQPKPLKLSMYQWHGTLIIRIFLSEVCWYLKLEMEERRYCPLALLQIFEKLKEKNTNRKFKYSFQNVRAILSIRNSAIIFLIDKYFPFFIFPINGVNSFKSLLCFSRVGRNNSSHLWTWSGSITLSLLLSLWTSERHGSMIEETNREGGCQMRW